MSFANFMRRDKTTSEKEFKVDRIDTRLIEAKEIKLNGSAIDPSNFGSGSITGVDYDATTDKLNVSKDLESTNNITAPNITTNTNNIQANADNLTNFTLSTINSLQTNTNNITSNSNLIQGLQHDVSASTSGVSANSTNIATNTTAISNLQASLIQAYTTENLPHNASIGAIAFDTTISKPVYFVDGKWLKLADDSLVVDTNAP